MVNLIHLASDTVIPMGTKYMGDVVAGHIAVKELHHIVDEIQAMGEVAGPMGLQIGEMLGRAVAGHSIASVKENGNKISEGIQLLTNHAVGLIIPVKKEQNEKISNSVKKTTENGA